MANTIKTRPSVGDVFMIIDGEKRFVGSDATKAFLDDNDCVGVVYDVQGNYFRVVAGVNTTQKRWSEVADYEITAVPSASGDYAVTLNDVLQGNFHYYLSTGTIAEFTTQLNDWLEEQASDTKAAKWEAYTNSDTGKSYLQMKTYDEYEDVVSIAGTTLSKLIGSELAAYTVTGNRNAIKQSINCNGMCRAQLEAYVKDNATSYCNPTTAMDGTTKLFDTYPCSQAYYSGNLGSNLRAKYTTYSDYLDACMVRLRELNHGCMQYRDGKTMTDLLYSKTVLKDGVSTKAYPAACYCKDYDCDVDGYGAGTFWLPSMYELGLLMRDRTGTSADPVHVALGKRTGWSNIGISSSRWSCCRCSTVYAWYYLSRGIANSYYFCGQFAVSPVSAFTL